MACEGVSPKLVSLILDTWKQLCSEDETTPERTRLHKILAKNTAEAVGTIEKPVGKFTENGKETLEVLFKAQFLNSFAVPDFGDDI